MAGRPLAPTIDAPVVGFRYWWHWPRDLRQLFWRDDPLYKQTNNGLYGAAGCFYWDRAYQRAEHAWGAKHREPMENCVCGIHAFTRWRTRESLGWFDQWPSAMFGHQVGLVGGAIIAWGRVVEHGDSASEGFRAEHAQILALGDKTAARLYRVPYVPEASLEGYAAEFGVRFDEIPMSGQ